MADLTCSVDDCEQPVHVKKHGLCKLHYDRWYRAALRELRGPIVRLGRRCDVDGCERPHSAHGLCHVHYGRWKARGTTERHRIPPLEERFWAKVDKTETCWLWTGALSQGYGNVAGGARGKGTRWYKRAHRLAYEMLVGPIPDGLHLDHLCRNRACVNPAHLEPVTNRENILRGENFAGVNARKTHCKWGHEFTPENTKVTKQGLRQCRMCSLASTAWTSELRKSP